MLPLRDRNPTRRTAYVTVALIVVNVAVWLFVQGAGSSAVVDQNEFVYERAAIPCEISTGEPLTVQEERTGECIDDGGRRSQQFFPDKNVYLSILVSMFLHGSWLHIIGNMLFLWVFGNNIEDRLGPFLYLGFYLLGGLAATLAQVALDTGSVIPMVGASGAIAAVMGAYLVWYPRAPIVTLVLLLLIWVTEIPAWLLLSVWFAMQFFTGSDSGVAWMAHVGGFVFGVAVGVLLLGRRSKPPRPAIYDAWR